MICFLISLLFITSILRPWADAVKTLPPPCGLEPNASYRLISEVNLIESRQSFIFEEWASREKGQFRLIITDRLSGFRSTLLKESFNGEIFSFKPFECSSVQDPKSFISEEFADKLPNQDSWLISGISSLWLYASKLKSQTFLEGKSPDLDVYGKSKISSKWVFSSFNSYTMNETSIIPYTMKFYLHSNLKGNQDDLPSSMEAIHLMRNSDSKIVLRVRILEFNSPITSVEPSSSNVFDLPQGYGCKRKSLIDKPEAPLILDPQKPQMLETIVTSSTFITDTSISDACKSQSMSYRIMMGIIDTDGTRKREFLSVEMTDHHYRELTGTSNVTKSAELRRRKKVWDLGDVSENESRGESFYYEVDQQSGKCLDFGLANHESAADIWIRIRKSVDRLEFVDAGFPISPKILAILLSNVEDFHMLSKKSLTFRTFEVYYEKRFDSFELLSSSGEILWKGPISVVRRTTEKDPLVEQRQKNSITGEFYPIDVTIFFLSPDFKQMMAQLKIKVVDRQLLAESYFFRSLNVESCLTMDTSTRGFLSSDSSLNADFSVSYQLESDELYKRLLSEEESFRLNVYSQYIKDLIKVSQGKLNILQLVDLEVNINPEELTVTGRLVEVSPLLGYARRKGKSLAEKVSVGLLVEVEPDEKSCGVNCNHFNCTSFTYCLKSRTCSLNLGGETEGELVDKSACDTFVKMSPKLDARADPMRLMQVIHHKLSSEDNQIKPLRIHFETHDGGEQINLDAESLNLISRDYREQIGKRQLSGDRLISVPDVLEAQTLGSEFELLFDGSKFVTLHGTNRDFPIEQTNHINYADCQALCAQMDCRSFSYCQGEQSCQISMLHAKSAIATNLVKEDLCSVMAREYTSKFYRDIDGLAESTIDETKKSFVVESERDCARLCLEEDTFTCRSFYRCGPNGGHEFNCHLSIQRDIAVKSATIDSQIPTGNECTFFRRSHLVEFGKFLGKSLPDSNDKREILVLKGLSSDDCAAECISRSPTCEAFDVCPTASRYSRPTCAISNRLIEHQIEWLTIGSLVDDPKCVTYLLSEPKNTKAIRTGAYSSNEPKHNPIFSFILLPSIGLAIGYSLSYLISSKALISSQL